MRSSAAALFLFFSLCPTAHARQALLWIAAEDSDKSSVLELLEKREDIKLTAALGSMSAQQEEKARKLAAGGRLEIALRIPGDPLLPLFYYPSEPGVAWTNKPSTPIAPNDQYFLALRLTQAVEAHTKSFKGKPLGLVNSPGGFLKDYPPLLKSLGVEWTASGQAFSTAAPVDCGGVYAVPFSSESAAGDPGAFS